MKVYGLILFTACLIMSCNSEKGNSTENTKSTDTAAGQQKEQVLFFPVTDYIKGHVEEIKKSGINPIKITSHGNRTDSSWIKIEDLDKEIAVFLTPVINNTNMTALFSEHKFLDQTINAFTFTYDPVKPLPDTFSLKHWDVYIDPGTNKVRRIFMVKETTDHKTLQLTWLHGKSCKIVTISNDRNGKPFAENEVNIKWEF